MSVKTTIDARKREIPARSPAIVVSTDITASATTDYIKRNDTRQKRPHSPMVRLKATVAEQLDFSASNQFVEQALRLRLQQIGQLPQKIVHTKIPLQSLSLSGLRLTPGGKEFKGTVFEGLPSLPGKVGYTAPTVMASARSSKVSLSPNRKRIKFDHLMRLAFFLPLLLLNAIALIGHYVGKSSKIVSFFRNVKQRKSKSVVEKVLIPAQSPKLAKKSNSKYVPKLQVKVATKGETKVATKVEKKLNPMEELVNAFPCALRPAVIELSKAVSCLSQAEVEALSTTVDWRTRKLIEMVSKAR